MKKIISLGGLLVAVFFTVMTIGCTPVNNPLGPITEAAPAPTVGPTVGPTPTTSTTKVMYLKIKGTPGIVSTFNVQVWVTRPSLPTIYLHNGTVTLDSTNSYEWSSTQSNPYTPTEATFFFSLTAPSNQGLTDEVHRIANSVDTIYATGYPAANGPDGGSFSF